MEAALAWKAFLDRVRPGRRVFDEKLAVVIDRYQRHPVTAEWEKDQPTQCRAALDNTEEGQ